MPFSTKNLVPPVQGRTAMHFDEVVSCLAHHGRRVDADFLREVYIFSDRMHEGQTRRSGEPYMVHPLNVAYLLAELNFDQTCIAVGLLHDVLEDTLTTREVLEKAWWVSAMRCTRSPPNFPKACVSASALPAPSLCRRRCFCSTNRLGPWTQ